MKIKTCFSLKLLGHFKQILYVSFQVQRKWKSITKMAATPIYGKNPSKNFFSGTGVPISTKTWYVAPGDSQPIIVCSNDDPGVDLDLFYGKVKFGNLGLFYRKNWKQVDFAETIEACDLKVGRCRTINWAKGRYGRSLSFFEKKSW